MKKINKSSPANGRYIWCYVNGESISPEGNGKSLGYALAVKHPYQKKNWKLFKLINVKGGK